MDFLPNLLVKTPEITFRKVFKLPKRIDKRTVFSKFPLVAFKKIILE